jgi:hypothetical protein
MANLASTLDNATAKIDVHDTHGKIGSRCPKLGPRFPYRSCPDLRRAVEEFRLSLFIGRVAVVENQGSPNAEVAKRIFNVPLDLFRQMKPIDEDQVVSRGRRLRIQHAKKVV